MSHPVHALAMSCSARSAAHTRLLKSSKTQFVRCLSLPAPPNFPERRRVAITGLGVVSPFGIGTKRCWDRILAGDVATRKLEGEGFAGLPCQVGAAVPRGKGEGLFDCDALDFAPASRTAPFVQMALLAAKEALEDAGATDAQHAVRELWGADGEERTAVCVGTGIGELASIVDTGAALHNGQYRKISPFFVPKVLANMAAAQISLRHRIRGPNHTMVTACATGAHCIIDAARLIALGEADTALAGGAESCIEPLAIAGFARAKSLATNYNNNPEAASRPFDADRCGFVMGEGAGVMVLEEMGAARRRGARIYGEVRGWGASGDAFHVTAPDEQGDGARRVMASAMRLGGVSPMQVGHINCHATSTPVGDACEAEAIRALFAANPELQITSAKGAMGHLLGAAGAVESILTVLSLYHKTIPATANLDNVSEDIPPSLRIVTGAPASVADLELALCNSFGFGGVNASILYGRVED